jgi:hypothetical protein
MSRTVNPTGNPIPLTNHDAKQSYRPPSEGEFGNFEKLTGKLLNVSKDELDEKRDGKA